MGFKRILRRIGKVAAFPVTAPIRAAKRGADKTMQAIILGIVRHALTTFGGALVGQGYLSGSELEAGVGALITIIGIVASVISKRTATAAAAK